MNLQIEQPYIEAMITEFPRLALLRDQRRFDNRINMPLHLLSGEELGFLGNLYRDVGPAMRSRAAQLTPLQQALNGQGTGFCAEAPTATHRDTDWSTTKASSALAPLQSNPAVTFSAVICARPPRSTTTTPGMK